MRIIKPSVEIVTPIDETDVIRHLELCGRVCYKSEDRITDESGGKFIQQIIRRGHESVLEHASFTVKFIVDRGVSHEIVRHRLAAYSQESTRYCNYTGDKFGSEITVIEPCFLIRDTKAWERWEDACSDAEDAYFDLLEWGCSSQEARSVLPNSLKTELMMTADIREWRHFLRLRTGKGAHPQMREIATQLLGRCKEKMPLLFGDIGSEKGA